MSEIETTIRANIWYIYPIFLAFFIGLILYNWQKSRGKIKVRIKTPIGEHEKWVKPEPNGKELIVEKRKGKNPGWNLAFTNNSLVQISSFFGLRKSFAIDCFYQAPKAIEYYYETSYIEKPMWDKKASKAFIDAEVLRQRGRGLKMQMSGLYWLILLVGIANFMLVLFLLFRSGAFGGVPIR